jgi:hypothetical protein
MVALMLPKDFLRFLVYWKDIKTTTFICGGLANSLEALRIAGGLSPD